MVHDFVMYSYVVVLNFIWSEREGLVEKTYELLRIRQINFSTVKLIPYS